jgi:APA family basic amino acid/polyamine antiporter
MVVVGGIIGAGIFLNPAAVAKATESNSAVLLAWALGGVFALTGAFIYAELGARRPQAGGGKVKQREANGPLIAFLYGWIMLLVNYSGSIATVATIFGTYACKAIGLPLEFVKPIAVGAIVLIAGINFFGIRAGATVQNIVTMLKLAAVAALIVTGLWFAGVGSDVAAVPTAAAAKTGFGTAMLPVMFAYSGWFYINNIAGEIREPQRNIPRALVLGMLTCTACYLLANYAYLHALGHAGLAASSAPAAEVMQRAFGPIGATAIAAGIAISTFGFCNIALLGGARMFQVMGADGVFFRAASVLHPRYRSPHVALFGLAAWSIILLLSGTFEELLNYSTVGDWLGSAMVVATLFYYRRVEGAEPVFRSPGHPWLPLLFIAAVVAVVASTTFDKPRDTLIGLAIIFAGIPVYYAWRKFAAR